MDACRRPMHPAPLAPTDPEDDLAETWFHFGTLCFTAPLDPRHLPPLGHPGFQIAWLIGFATAWFCGWNSEDEDPIDDDITLYTAITATLRDHPALLLQIMAIPSVGESCGPH
ncbi:hypothetical protein [Thiocapsa imhoffii]|nr:hypothetical protein [Thiocapsa imhoffii]